MSSAPRPTPDPQLTQKQSWVDRILKTKSQALPFEQGSCPFSLIGINILRHISGEQWIFPWLADQYLPLNHAFGNCLLVVCRGGVVNNLASCFSYNSDHIWKVLTWLEGASKHPEVVKGAKEIQGGSQQNVGKNTGPFPTSNTFYITGCGSRRGGKQSEAKKAGNKLSLAAAASKLATRRQKRALAEGSW